MEAIRSSNGKWLNSTVFREEAIKFMKNGFYCAEPKGSPAYMDYWTEQLRRCKDGYVIGDCSITGHHYSYLNYSQIQVVEDQGGTRVARKITKMPDFWDGDYDYYWCLEIARNGLFNKMSTAPSTQEERDEWNKLNEQIEDTKREHPGTFESNNEYLGAKLRRDDISNIVLNRLGLRVKPHIDFLDGGHHMIVGKSRRKGYSYKNADICKNTYNTIRNSLTLIGAFDKKFLYPKGTMGMASTYLSFLNKHTAWTKAREYVDKQEHKRASYVKTTNGIKVEAGYMSDIMALTFADNPDAARGKDALYVLLEEGGAFPNLKDSFNATAPGLTAGKFITGQIIIFGTGGDMESGTADFADMFYNPIQYNLMPFVNIWDENAENTYCGFFHPVSMNMEGYYDEQGNSDVVGATAHEKAIRADLLKNSTSSNVLQSRVQEWCLCPAEAFLTVSMNDFPVVELRQQYNKVVREKLHLKFGQPVYLTRINDKVTAVPDLDDLVHPIWDYKVKTKDLKGGVVIFEHPQGDCPRGLYKIGFDPYRQVNGASLAVIYVYKTVQRGSATRNIIVAEYVGRPYSPEEVNRIAEMLAELYNTEIMHENEVTHVKDYFQKRKKLHLLAAQPDAVIARVHKNSTVARIYGCHMTEKLKDAGEKYIKEWLLEVRDYDEEGKAITNLETIYDPGLLEELILYNRKGNFDRVMAFMMVMFQVTEDGEDYEYSTGNESDNGKDLLALMKIQFTNNNSNW